MIFLELTEEEKERVKRLTGDKALLFALKKLFLSSFIQEPASNGVEHAAAQRIAIEYLRKAFQELNAIAPHREELGEKDNFV